MKPCRTHYALLFAAVLAYGVLVGLLCLRNYRLDNELSFTRSLLGIPKGSSGNASLQPILQRLLHLMPDAVHTTLRHGV